MGIFNNVNKTLKRCIVMNELSKYKEKKGKERKIKKGIIIEVNEN